VPAAPRSPTGSIGVPLAPRAVTPVLTSEASGGTAARRSAEEYQRQRAITFGMMAVPQMAPARDTTAPVSVKGTASTAERVAIAEKLAAHSEDDLRAEAQRIINESDVFVKYGLIERAVEHLRKVFEFDPAHAGARERLVAVLLQLGRKGEAAAELESMAESLVSSRPQEAEQHARRALELDPRAPRAQRTLDQLARRAAGLPVPAASVGTSPAAGPAGGESGEALDLDAIPDLVLEEETAEALDIGDSRGYEDLEISGTGAGGATIPASARAPFAAPADAAAPALGPGDSALPRSSLGALATARGTAPSSSGMAVGAPADLGIVVMDELLPPAELGAASELGEATAAEEFDNPRTTADADAGALLGELEQVDFFIEQGMFEDAAGLLDGLDPKHAHHPLVLQRRQRLGETPTPPPELDAGVTAEAPAEAATTQDDLLGLGDIDLGLPTEPVPTERAPDPTPTAPMNATLDPAGMSPRAMVAAGETPDGSTHADLGIAYKEMGLLDAAIKEFSALAQDPAREVFALTMIGECYEGKGAPAEALIHYKKALNRPSVRDDESLQLYFQLGRVFQSLGDRTEALFFYEKVMKRDAGFADVSRRIAALRGEGGPARLPGGRP
jgi:tetratricopeptide (TPR) repeat protein